MSWKDLLQKDDERIVVPWLGGRTIRVGPRSWVIVGDVPQEHGWNTFILHGRRASLDPVNALEPCTLPPGPYEYCEQVKGYLVGDHIVPDNASVDPDPVKIAGSTEQVHLIEPGLGRFVRIVAGRAYEDGPLIFDGPDMPYGPEDEVTRAFENKSESVDKIPGVTPALDAAFRMESFQRAEAIRRRAELEKLRKEEEARLAREARAAELRDKLGDGLKRREMAVHDFGEAARAALLMGEAEYLDHRAAHGKNEMVVTFRTIQRRFECTCDKNTLRIIDSGICLTDHRTGVKGDTKFTLETLPSVIREAERTGKLVVYRHVYDPDAPQDDYEDDDDY
jgi:hypothetical protein